MRQGRLSSRGWKAMAGAGGLALGLAGLLGADAAMARPDGPGCGGRDGVEGIERKLESLDLDAETQAAVDSVIEQARVSGRAQRKQLREAHEQMRTLLQQDAPSVDAVMAQADLIGGLEVAMQKQRLRTMLDLRSLVGAERWKELDFGKRHERS